MKAIPFYLAYSFIWLITLLPLRILYIISDLIYLLLYHVARYRRTVVIKNLQNAFPEKSRDEIHAQNRSVLLPAYQSCDI